MPSSNDLRDTPAGSTAGLMVTGIDRHSDQVRIRLAGDIDIATADQVDAALTQAFADRRSGWLEVDLRDVAFLDSSGIHVLIRWHHRARVQGCQLLVTNAQDIVRHVLQVTGLLDMLGPTVPARVDD